MISFAVGERIRKKSAVGADFFHFYHVSPLVLLGRRLLRAGADYPPNPPASGRAFSSAELMFCECLCEA